MSKSRFICPTVQSRAYGLEWLGVICTTETYQGFLLFFLRKEALLTPLTSTHNFSQISFSLLHLTVVKILVQLTLLISKTGFRVWVLDWSVRHIFFFFAHESLVYFIITLSTTGLATPSLGIWAYQNGSNHMLWPFFSNVKTFQQRKIILLIPTKRVPLPWIPNGSPSEGSVKSE